MLGAFGSAAQTHARDALDSQLSFRVVVSLCCTVFRLFVACWHIGSLSLIASARARALCVHGACCRAAAAAAALARSRAQKERHTTGLWARQQAAAQFPRQPIRDYLILLLSTRERWAHKRAHGAQCARIKAINTVRLNQDSAAYVCLCARGKYVRVCIHMYMYYYT